MKKTPIGRRAFIKDIAGSAAVASLLPVGAPRRSLGEGGTPLRQAAPKIRFAVIGINHAHINSQVDAVLRGGGEFAAVYAKEPDLLETFTKRFPQAKLARSENEILEDGKIQLVLSSAIPDERAPLGIRVMKHGKDYMADRPGITTLAQLAEVRKVRPRQADHSIIQQRFENRATVKTGSFRRRLDRPRGADVSLGPHRMSPKARPAWFDGRATAASCATSRHTRPTSSCNSRVDAGRVVASQVGNVHYPSPAFEDCDVMLPGNRGTGLLRGLVHARWPGDLGRRAADHPGTDRFIGSANTIRGARREPSVRRPKETATSTVARCRCRTASSSSPTS